MGSTAGEDHERGRADATRGVDLSRHTRDAIYTAVGLGVLGFQQAQVRRRELQRCLTQIKKAVVERDLLSS